MKDSIKPIELTELRFNAILRDDPTAKVLNCALHGSATALFQRLIEKHNYTPEDSLFAISQELMDVQGVLAEVIFTDG